MHSRHSLLAVVVASSLVPNAAPLRCEQPPQVEYELDRLGAEDPAWLDAASVGAISDIGAFLDTCPTTDPVYAQLRADFELRRNGVKVGTIPCSAPVSTIPAPQYTDELIVAQGLRVIYYMDLGGSGHLPWTPGRLYAWMKSKIAGVDIRDGSGSFCCETFGGKLFIAVGAQNDFNRDFDKHWRGISGNIGLYAHEVRHVDGYPHVSCCGVNNGCDQQYDESHLSPYGIQFFLERAWLRGDINVGFACLAPVEFQETVDWHLSGCNLQFRGRFCTNQPSTVEKPAQPGGPCLASAACVPGPETLCLNGGRFAVRTSWATAQGGAGVGHAVALTADTGYFWFFNSANVEVVVKVLNGCGLNQRYWVFAAGLTDVEVALAVEDTLTDSPKTYTNTQGHKFAPIQDTGAFATCP